MNARKKFKIGDRVRLKAAALKFSFRARTYQEHPCGTVTGFSCRYPHVIQVLRDNNKRSQRWSMYWWVHD